MTWTPRREPGGDLRPVGEALDRYVRRAGGPGRAALTAVFSDWDAIVGPSVAAHARPLSLRDGTLTVAVDAPAWATQLRFLAADLLAKLNAVAGEAAITALDVKVRR